MWSPLATFDLNENWQLSNEVTANSFRLKHKWVNSYRYSPVAIAALAREGEDGLEIYSPQKIYPKTELEILQFPLAPTGWKYSLAVKQLIFNSNLIQWSLSIDMPLYSITSDPTPNANASSAFTTTTSAVSNANPVKLLSVNTTRKAFTVYNPDKTNSIYADVINTVSSTVASFIVPPGQVYISDFDWTGEVWAITKTGTISATVREFT